MSDKDYRKIVHDWLRLQNECWLGGDFNAFFDYITPGCERELQEERKRWRMIRNLQEKRRMTPVKCETNILSVDERAGGNQIDVQVLVSVQHVYSIQHQLLDEEKEEWACFRLNRTRDGWKIAKFTTADSPRPGLHNRLITIPSAVNPEPGARSTSSGYNRAKAVQYAETHWNAPNPGYLYFSQDDCTNFVSQCLHAGGIPMQFSQRRDQGWWYRQSGRNHVWSYSWTVAQSFYQYLKGQRSRGLRAVQVQSAEQLEPGDIICYDWEGDGRWNHNVIVTGFDPNGAPLVNAHTTNSRHRYWEYKDSPAWTPRTRYAFFHIL
ncbi:amidase domain-containing protein [Lihuaxuella thermophila]|uniref:Putative amidase domain-containing protein n=1 Tax=Lihuaxuella thermophila TaxID=1173111 RepID=A0A1H8H993_9BACL|nr:amidase domain-containing protein [Lihuaxuella thermophila]SEN52736.1 Putative amidase domain-containing protein [Lihuaxuella thermophila]